MEQVDILIVGGGPSGLAAAIAAKENGAQDVLVIEDIVDSGMTLSFLRENLLSRGAASLKIATLLDKPERRRVPLHVDYFGFTIPDEFVVGYGLDYDEKYRNLPDIRPQSDISICRLSALPSPESY